jgi:hypothetical protein
MKREWNPVGQWYLRRDTQEMLQVLDYDAESGIIGVQTFDGDLDEIEEESWRALALEPAEPPEDWTGALDNLEEEDIDEFVMASDSQSIEPFTDYREPWEDILAEEAMATDLEERKGQRESADGEWMTQAVRPDDRSFKTVPARAGV